MPAFKSHRSNPAPSPAKRSAKFHRIRKGFVAKLKAAVRRGDLDEQAKWGRKLLKLDRMFYAPRNVKRRTRPNPSRSKTKYYIVCINYPVGSAYAQITSDTHGDERFSFRITGDKDKATFTQSLSAAKRWAKGIANTARFPTTVETAFQ